MRITTGRSLTEQIVDAIRQDITTGRLPPGSRHSVQTFADELQVSRTPVREALVRLAEAGMVRFERNVGVLILEPTVEDLLGIFQLRLMLEPRAAHRAVLRADDTLRTRLREELAAMQRAVESDASDRFDRFMEHDVLFHELILAATGNKRLVQLLRNLRDATWTLGASALLEAATGTRHDTASDLARSLEDVMRDHQPVLAAIEAGNPQDAEAHMRKHVLRTGDMLMRQLAADTQDHGAYDPHWAEGLI